MNSIHAKVTPRRVLLVLAAVAAVLLLCAPAAHADAQAGDCQEEPVPEAPGRGVTGFVTSTPQPLPPPGPLFTDGGVPVFERWAFAGMRWNTYDTGCGSPWVRAPDAMIGTMLGNWALEAPKFGVGVTTAVTRAAYNPTFLSVFDPLIANAVDTLQTVLFNRWVPVFLAIAGAILLWRATRLRMATAASAAAWALLVITAATVIFHWPVKTGSFVDRGVGQVVGTVHTGINHNDSADPADDAAQSMYYAVLWEHWKTGMFGSADSAVARKYADEMFAAQSLTWRQARIVENDPDGEGQEILDRKADLFHDTAAKIENEDPDAYQYLTGKKSEARVGAALIAWVAAACVLPLMFASAVLIIAAYIIVRLAVMLFPAVATIGVVHSFRGLVQGVANVVMAAVINCVVFAVGAALNLLAIQIVLSPTSRLPTWLGLLLAALTALVMWFALKPFTRLTKMASPSHNVFRETSDTIRNAGSKAGGLVKTAAVAAAGGAAGGAAGAAAGANAVADSEPAKRRRSESYSAPEPTPGPAALDAQARRALPAGNGAEPAPQPPTPTAPPAGGGTLPPLPPAAAGAAAVNGHPPARGLERAPRVYGSPPALTTGHTPPAQAPRPPDSGAAPGVAEIPAPPVEHEQEPPLPGRHLAPGTEQPTVILPVSPGGVSHPPLAPVADGQPDQDGQPAGRPGQPETSGPVGGGPMPAHASDTDVDQGIYYTPAGESLPRPETEPTLAEVEIGDDGQEVHGLFVPEHVDEREDAER
jgi:hypothetical protein